MKKRVILSMLLPGLLLTPLAGQQPDAMEVMNRSRELSLAGSMSADIHLAISEKNGATRLRTLALTTKSYKDEMEKRYIKFLEPADVKGTAMLITDNKNTPDEMWIYLPALKKTRRIVSSEKGKSFMSSEFSNADMSSPSLADFNHKHISGSGSSNEWIIESVPISEDKAEEYGYSRKVSYISKDKYQILKMDFYNFDGTLFKTIRILGVYPLPDGKFIVKSMEADNLLNGRKSAIDMKNISVGVQVDESVFNIQNLER